VTKRTLFVANDNDLLAIIADPLEPACISGQSCSRESVPNPNRFNVFAFGDEDLSRLGYGPYLPQPLREKGPCVLHWQLRWPKKR
jgi:hypothetical protein